jgi:ATP-dependent RNA helicase DeaD
VPDDLQASGLAPEIVAAAAAAGYDSLTPLQAAALPVLRRGGSVVLHASSGAGVTGAFGLPLLDRLIELPRGEAGPTALVLAPTAERADAVARQMAAFGADAGIAVRAAGPGWRTAGTAVLVCATARALVDVQGSVLKLDAVQALVVLDLAEQFRLGLGDAIDTLVSLVPRDAQRVITTADFTADVERFVEAHARRAITIPARPANPGRVSEREPVGQIGYIVVDEAEKPALAARLLESAEGAVLIFVRTARRAAQVQAELRHRGIGDGAGSNVRVAAFGANATGGARVSAAGTGAGGAGGRARAGAAGRARVAAAGGARVAAFGADATGGAGSARVLSYDVPFSADELRRLHAAGGTVMVTPAELHHFRRITAEVPFTVKQRRAREFELDELDAFRQTVRAALEGDDLAAQLLVLEPLFDEHSPAEVAAALSALLRRRAPVQAPRPAAGVDPGAAPKAAVSSGFARLFISIGTRDNVRPGDIVGAITGEAGVHGDQVGRVDIRDTFSVVEVSAAVADRVIRALNGTTMRGRSLRVDFDRKGSGADRKGSGDDRKRSGFDRKGPGDDRKRSGFDRKGPGDGGAGPRRGGRPAAGRGPGPGPGRSPGRAPGRRRPPG